MTDEGRLYEFVYRASLTEEALDRAGRRDHRFSSLEEADILDALPLDSFEDDVLVPAQRMSLVYATIAAFENSVRAFVAKVLMEAHGPSWWEDGISEKIRKTADSRRKDEERVKWHAPRGDNSLNYTDLGQLAGIIQQNWDFFEPHVRSAEWAKAIFDGIERSRNVIMHSGSLDLEDIARVGINMRDWLKQVGA